MIEAINVYRQHFQNRLWPNYTFDFPQNLIAEYIPQISKILPRLTLSHSQSQELELILSDETLLSSAKHSEDLDAARFFVVGPILVS
jgi:hypothetical protein